MATKEDRRRMAAVLGSKGGKARVKAQTPEERRESARRAAQARWSKRKGGQK